MDAGRQLLEGKGEIKAQPNLWGRLYNPREKRRWARCAPHFFHESGSRIRKQRQKD